ncbi:MAG: CvpA family protein [Actinomycetes bacterium]
MKLNLVDYIFAVILLASFIRGYKAGLLATLFSAIGFIFGGLTGLMAALHFVGSWSPWTKFGTVIAVMLIAASIGEYLFRSSAKFLHTKVLFGPFKWLDSIAGAVLSLARSILLFYLFTALLTVSPWGWAKANVPLSRSYIEVHKHVPSLLLDVENQIKTNFAKIYRSPIKYSTKVN